MARSGAELAPVTVRSPNTKTHTPSVVAVRVKTLSCVASVRGCVRLAPSDATRPFYLTFLPGCRFSEVRWSRAMMSCVAVCWWHRLVALGILHRSHPQTKGPWRPPPTNEEEAWAEGTRAQGNKARLYSCSACPARVIVAWSFS